MLKDLVWKETNKDEEIDKLFTKHSNIWTEADTNESRAKFMFDNAEQIAKEKQEILNKTIEYTKEDIVNMFVEAGFVYDGGVLTFEIRKRKISIYTNDRDSLYFCYISWECTAETTYCNFNDRKSIEFYYNTFRNILEFEVNRHD